MYESIEPKDALIFAFLTLIIFILFFLIIREIVMWYYKINKRVEIMRETNKLLRELIGEVKKNNSNSNQL